MPSPAHGGAPIERTWDPKQASPSVDEIHDAGGVAATIFQRMNDAGDMLRIATNVVGNDGKRGIGTYIAARKADGAPNTVIASVLRGQRFAGRAFVVNDWYLAAYEPIREGDELAVFTAVSGG